MKRLLAVMIAVAAASCSDQAMMPVQHTALSNELQFLEFSPAAFANTHKQASFWAVHGQNRKLILRYADTGREYFRFEVDKESLAKRPDGTPFQRGDSIQITVQADPLGRWAFHFSPAGLRFNRMAPAQLSLEFERSFEDGMGASAVSLWQRQQPGTPWELLSATNLTAKIAHTHVHDFTDFGLAIN